MTTQQLLEWMKAPQMLGKESAAQLEALTRSFPYFQTGHLLYIKSLHNESSFLYNHQLKVAAAYSGSRRVLYELITQKNKPTEIVNTIENTVAEKQISESLEPVALPENTIQESVSKNPEFPKKRFVTDPDEWETAELRQLYMLRHWKNRPATTEKQEIPQTTEESSSLATPEPENKNASDVVEQKSAAEEMHELLYVLVEPDGEDITLSDASETTTLENEEPVSFEITPIAVAVEEEKNKEDEFISLPPIAVPQDPVEQEIFREVISSTIGIEAEWMATTDALPKPEDLIPPGKIDEQELIAEEILPAESKIEQVNAEASEELSFSSWLKKITPEQEAQPQEKTVEQHVRPKNILQELAATQTPESNAENTSTEPPKESLIEKFIQDEPRIQPNKTGFYNPVNMAKKSVQERDEFITETLAKIYVKQGNIPKALSAYRKLSAKFPAKAEYFAAIMEELRRTPTKK
ncbi:MAG: hypothetical protein ACRCYO_20105 [Bacteroidia bacterium]